jgi:hypothetical protein
MEYAPAVVCSQSEKKINSGVQFNAQPRDGPTIEPQINCLDDGPKPRYLITLQDEDERPGFLVDFPRALGSIWESGISAFGSRCSNTEGFVSPTKLPIHGTLTLSNSMVMKISPRGIQSDQCGWVDGNAIPVPRGARRRGVWVLWEVTSPTFFYKMGTSK